jgi:phage-related protein
MAVVAVFVILWNECEGFRNFFIALWDAIVVAFKAVVAWFEQAGKDIASFFVGAWNGIVSAWNACGKFFSDCWNAIKNAFAAVGKWFSDIFTGAWNGIKKAFSAVGSFFTGIWESIKSIFSKVGSVIGGAVSNAFSTAINWVLKTAIGIINGFISAINFAISIINAIPGVNITQIKKLDVPKLAKGGIVDSATLAVIGERGKEAVVPLENNTGWMDMLAERISNRGNTPSKIVLALDGKELGYATINSINNITRQTGTLQLAIV